MFSLIFPPKDVETTVDKTILATDMATINLAADENMDVVIKAAAVARLLDTAADHIQRFRKASPGSATKDLGGYDSEIATIRTLVQQIRFVQDLQTPPLASALTMLEIILEKLVKVSSESLDSLQQLEHAMDELIDAARDLRLKMLADTLRTPNKLSDGYQVNVSFGGHDTRRRVYSSIDMDQSRHAFQVNAPLHRFEDPASFAQLAAILAQVRQK